MEQVYPGMLVHDVNGPIGTVEAVETGTTAGAERVIVRRDDGQRVVLAANMFRVQGDALVLAAGAVSDQTIGTTRRAAVMETAAARTVDVPPGGELRVPVIEEQVIVEKRAVEHGGVRVQKTVDQREEVIETPILHEAVDVQRIPIGRVVETAPQMREEGDTLIIPVLEEMLVVEKRLILKEEVHVLRRRTHDVQRESVVLRQEHVVVEPIDERQAGT